MSDKLFYTFEALSETFFIFMLFVVVFAILSLQLFSGLLKYRCVDQTSGLLKIDIIELCNSNQLCQNTYDGDFLCLKTIGNPDHGITNFDNVFNSFIMTFKIISLDNWTDVLLLLENAFNQFIWIYILITIIIGNFFLFNIMAAVLKVKFSEQRPSALIDIYLEKYKEKCFDMKQMKKEGFFHKKISKNERQKGFLYKPWEIFKTMNFKNLFSMKRMKLKSIEGLMRFGGKKLTNRQSVNLKKMLDKKKTKLLNALTIKFKAKNFEVRVKFNDNHESDSALDVMPTM